MNNTTRIKAIYFAPALPLIIFLSSFLLALSSWAIRHPELYVGITYDLMLLAPISYFLIIIWTKKIPNITVIPVFVLGMLIAGWVLPEEHQMHYQILSGIIAPLLELGAVSAVAYFSYHTWKENKKQKDSGLDMLQILQNSTARLLPFPKIAPILSSEIAAFYYAFLAWKKPQPDARSFSGYRESGILSTIYVLLFVMLVETIVLHILLSLWNIYVAWIITILSLYGCLVFFAHAKALTRRPHILGDKYLELKSGIFGYARITYTQIEKVEINDREAQEEEAAITHKLGFLQKLEPHNLVLHLKSPAQAEQAYGLKKTYQNLQVFVDQKEKFKAALDEKISQ